MTTYADLGLRPIINAAATLTRLGGSRMPAPVVEAMVAAAGSFIDLELLQERVGARIAQLTHNEACYVSSGAAAGIVLAVAACITGSDRAAIGHFPHIEHTRNTVIIHHSQRNSYDYAIRQTGARLVEIGTAQFTQPDELRAAITPQVACIVYFAGTHYASGALPLADVIEIAHAARVPVVVDAAAQIPPISNLWQFTRENGADLVIFSGGKGLRGPQSAGLVLGRPDLIQACHLNGNPYASIGRPMKVGKEELMGMLAAIEWSLAQDEPALLEHYERIVQYWLSGLQDLAGIQANRGYPSEAGQPHPRTIVQILPTSGHSRDQVVAALLHGDPAVAVGSIGTDTIALNPQTIAPGEEHLVLTALRNVLGV
ncbi:MAG: aminotransferase class V-fold PLP-dependent enzyme [Roseiflexaceae bacterium]|nr:aminotransferase class V-fold PLP-dependent enzyme [Roseiflexaceae bacterium]